MNKKEILKELEAHFGEKPQYMGAPTFAYQLKTGDDVYIIDREGKIKNPQGSEVELDKLIKGGSEVTSFENTPTEVTEEPQPKAIIPKDEPTVDRMEVVLPMGDHTVYTLRNLVNMIASKQDLIQQALNLQREIVDEEFTKAINEKVMAMFQDFETVLLEVGPEKCPGIAFDFNQKTITFKFYEGKLEPDNLKAYTDLVTLINMNAQNLKHASCKPTTTDNPKYSFRTWLIRLGMIGEEYRTTRKILLANLEGNSSFRKAGGKDE